MLPRHAVLSVVMLTSCQNDGIRDRLAAGCRMEPECRALQAQAEARVAEFASDTDGRVRCDGTISPTCTYVHRGCCSHHRGVCPCK